MPGLPISYLHAEKVSAAYIDDLIARLHAKGYEKVAIALTLSEASAWTDGKRYVLVLGNQYCLLEGQPS